MYGWLGVSVNASWSSFIPIGSYGYNSWGTGESGAQPLQLHLGLGDFFVGNLVSEQPSALAEANVLAPSAMIAIGDVYLTAGYITPDFFGLAGGRHGTSDNMLFCDGHLEFGKTNSLYAKTQPSRLRWNNDHEPHPETWSP